MNLWACFIIMLVYHPHTARLEVELKDSTTNNNYNNSNSKSKTAIIMGCIANSNWRQLNIEYVVVWCNDVNTVIDASLKKGALDILERKSQDFNKFRLLTISFSSGTEGCQVSTSQVILKLVNDNWLRNHQIIETCWVSNAFTKFYVKDARNRKLRHWPTPI